MQITCRRQDQARFEELGFHLEFEQAAHCPVIEMVDEEANYGHYDAMPTDIPFQAWHGAGCNYGDGKIACDGNHYAEVGATSDGFVVAWDYQTQQPTQRSLDAIRHYLGVHQKVQELFKKLSATATQNPAP